MVTISNFGSQVNPASVFDTSSTSKKASLGIHGSIASETTNVFSLTSPVIQRFYLQSLSRELLMSQAVASCLRCRQANRPTVDVMKNISTGKVHYSGLQTCKSIWHCPVCGARISEGRRQELAAALSDAHITEPDGSVTPLFSVLITYTFQHNKSMSCASSVAGILSAYRRLKSGRFYKDLKEEYGIVGSVRALENLWGVKNGWHPHIHELVLFSAPLNEAALHGLKTALKGHWRSVLAKEGLTASFEHGVDARASTDEKTDAAVMDYIAKFGHEPEQKSEGWTITHELVKSGSKKSGGFELFSMLELLQSYGNGDVKAGRLFKEYGLCFKGRNQLVWSRGLRDLLGIGEEKPDGDLAEESDSPTDGRLASLSPDQWRAILKADVRGELKLIGEEKSEADFNLWLADILARYMPSVVAPTVVVGRASDGSYQFS